jgi:histone deacetylase complex regulatory component SIN3
MIDTQGAIMSVLKLFQGNNKLIIGFNAFLPEGYNIEVPPDGEGPPVVVFQPPLEKREVLLALRYYLLVAKQHQHQEERGHRPR